MGIMFFSCAFLGLLGLLCGILSENYEQKSDKRNWDKTRSLWQ
jgi:hypothetical protein